MLFFLLFQVDREREREKGDLKSQSEWPVFKRVVTRHLSSSFSTKRRKGIFSAQRHRQTVETGGGCKEGGPGRWLDRWEMAYKIGSVTSSITRFPPLYSRVSPIFFFDSYNWLFIYSILFVFEILLLPSCFFFVFFLGVSLLVRFSHPHQIDTRALGTRERLTQ